VTVDSLGRVTLEIARYPDLSPNRGAALTLLLHPPQPAPLPGQPPLIAVLLVQWARGSFTATNSQCPHKGCPLGYTLADGTTSQGFGFIECPCHSSRFAATAYQTTGGQQFCTGDVLHAPSAQGLMVFPTNSDGTNVTIDLTSATLNPQTKPCQGIVQLPPVAGTTLSVPVAMYPQLGDVGGQIVGSPMGSPEILLLLARTAMSTVLAFDAACTHLGCPVSYSAGHMDLECPCHGSTYGLDGAVTMGPATNPLAKHPSTFDGQTVTITLM
jgi:Rieske Fe-S protein